jgi:hypothetical protein
MSKADARTVTELFREYGNGACYAGQFVPIQGPIRGLPTALRPSRCPRMCSSRRTSSRKFQASARLSRTSSPRFTAPAPIRAWRSCGWKSRPASRDAEGAGPSCGQGARLYRDLGITSLAELEAVPRMTASVNAKDSAGGAFCPVCEREMDLPPRAVVDVMDEALRRCAFEFFILKKLERQLTGCALACVVCARHTSRSKMLAAAMPEAFSLIKLCIGKNGKLSGTGLVAIQHSLLVELEYGR